jgi:hypothetical protein
VCFIVCKTTLELECAIMTTVYFPSAKKTNKTLKHESKDQLLVQVWNRDRTYPLKSCMPGVGYL